LTVWLPRLSIGISHGRPYHPQTHGKDERFNRTLSDEVLQGVSLKDLRHCQEAFDVWRGVYNVERPHQALDMVAPASRYNISSQSFLEALPPVEYGPEDLVRRAARSRDSRWRSGPPTPTVSGRYASSPTPSPRLT